LFNFIIRKKKIVVDCFTDSYNAYKFFPIQESTKILPNWWKNLSSTYQEERESGISIPRATIKRCEGIISLYQKGFTLPMWSDAVLESSGNKLRWEFADNSYTIATHGSQQMSEEFANYVHIKLVSPWRFKEKKGIQFTFVQPSWNQVSFIFGLHIPPGVVEFKNQFTTNVNAFMPKNVKISIPAGMPMAHFVPCTEDQIELKLHLLDQKEMEKLEVGNRSCPFFLGSYRKYIKARKNEN